MRFCRENEKWERAGGLQLCDTWLEVGGCSFVKRDVVLVLCKFEPAVFCLTNETFNKI